MSKASAYVPERHLSKEAEAQRHREIQQLRTSLGDTDLITTSQEGDETMVQKVIQDKVDYSDPLTRLRVYNWALSAAARAGFPRIVRLFMENGANANEVSPDEYCTALCEACAHGHEEIVKIFIEYGASLDSYCKGRPHGLPCHLHWPIFAAAAKGDHASIPCYGMTLYMRHMNIIKMIMQHQSALGSLDYARAFDAAASAGSMATIKLLIESSIKTNSVSLNYSSALGAAVEAGHQEIAKFMIANGADVNAYNDAKQPKTILAASIRPGNEEIVESLIQHGARLSPIRWGLHCNALERAAAIGEEQMVRMLISMDSNVESRQLTYSQALFPAVKRGHTKIVRLITQSAIKLGLKGTTYLDHNFCEAMICACRQSHADIVQDLIAAGALLEYRSTASKNALSEAIWYDQRDVVKILVENGVIVDEESNRHHFRAMHNATNPHRLVIVGNGQAIYIDDSDGNGLNEGRQSWHPDVDKFYPDDEFHRDSGNELHLAVILGNAEIVKILIESSTNVNAKTTGQMSPLHLAAKIGYIDILKILIANSADLGAIAGRQGTAFDIAAAYHHLDVFEVLVEHQISVLNHGDNTLNALMNLAVAMGHEKVIKTLIKHGTNINAQAGWCGSPLQNASVLGQNTIVNLLLENGASPNASGGYYGNALQTAAAHGHRDTVLALLEKGAAINAIGGRHETALRASIEAGSDEVVATLIAKGADVNALQNDFSNALIEASAKGLSNIVTILLQNGADVNTRGGWYGNALEAALACGHEQIVDILLEAGAETI